MSALNTLYRAFFATLAPPPAASCQASAAPFIRPNRLSTAGLLTVIALALFSSSAFAFEGGVVDNVFTGCVKRDGTVQYLRRGDEPRRACGGKAEKARFAEIPAGVAVVSWDIALARGEEFAPAPGIQIICLNNPAGFTDMQVIINQELMVDFSADTSTVIRDFNYHNDPVFGRSEDDIFLVRAVGTASNELPDDERPCRSTGFAELLR